MTSQRRGQLILVLVMAMFAGIWCGVLPIVARWDIVRARTDRFEEAGINPAAIYYTDHPSMRDMESRIEQSLRR
ncbi:hypothetical protein SH449x_001616 [Pirellulaceae bacterium SH449]